MLINIYVLFLEIVLVALFPSLLFVLETVVLHAGIAVLVVWGHRSHCRVG